MDANNKVNLRTLTSSGEKMSFPFDSAMEAMTATHNFVVLFDAVGGSTCWPLPLFGYENHIIIKMRLGSMACMIISSYMMIISLYTYTFV